MAKVCNHDCVGMLVWDEDRLLLIERALPPFGFAPPAGHVDDFDSFETAAREELREEVGLEAQELKLVAEGRRENACRRENGSWHYWKIYEVLADGELSPSERETKQVKWVSIDELQELAERTKQYMTGEVSEEEWNTNPGIEEIWYQWLVELGILDK